MPEALTQYSTIKSYCQDEVMDTTTTYWDAPAWQREINRVTKDILHEIRTYKAYSLCDLLLQYVDITGDGTGSYDWHAATVAASKTYYYWVKVTVNDNEEELDRISFVNWHNATREFIGVNDRLGVWTFGQDGNMYTRPELDASDTIHFWFIEKPTDMTADAHKPDVDESLVELYPIGTGIRWWRMNGEPDMVASLRQEWQYMVRQRIKPFGGSKIRRIKSTKSY